MIPTVEAWWAGDPAAREAGEAALRKLGRLSKRQPDVRRAVELVQKKWGVTPTKTLTGEQWARLLDEAGHAGAEDPEDPSPVPGPAGQ